MKHKYMHLIIIAELEIPLVFCRKNNLSINPSILLFLDLAVRMSPLALPIAAGIQEFMGYNPIFYLNKHLAMLFPQIPSLLIHLFPFHSQPFFSFLCFLGRWLITVIHYYESGRILGFLFFAAFCSSHTGISYIWLIHGLVAKHKERIKELRYWSHRTYYTGIHVALQTGENAIKFSLCLVFVCSVSVMIMVTYLPVKLHKSIELYLVIAYAFLSAFLFLFITVVLRGTEQFYEATLSLLDKFKESEMILRMGNRERKIVRRQVLAMKAVTLPIGMSFARFCVIETGSKTEISNYIVDQVISMLLTF